MLLDPSRRFPRTANTCSQAPFPHTSSSGAATWTKNRRYSDNGRKRLDELSTLDNVIEMDPTDKNPQRLFETFRNHLGIIVLVLDSEWYRSHVVGWVGGQ